MLTRTIQVIPLIFSLLLFMACVKVEEKEVKYPSGKIKEKYTYYLDELDQEIFDGEYNMWFESGSRKEQSFWDEGMLHGVQTIWFENGTKEFSGTWMGAKKNGLFQNWHVNGNLKSEINYEMDVPVGSEKHWHQSGKLRSEISYVEGKKHGIENVLDNTGKTYSTRYWARGSLDSVKTFIPENQIKMMRVEFAPGKTAEEFGYFLDPDGKQIKHGMLKEWYSNGQIERQVKYDVGIKSGLEEWFYENGKQKMLTRWKMGVKNGEEKTWWAGSGVIKSSEIFSDGVHEGPASHWYKNGKKQSQVNFVKGKLQGKAKYWHENGNMKSDYNYIDDNLDGLITRGFKNGKKRSECFYRMGSKEGECKEYFENGKLMTVAHFKNGMKELSTVKHYDSTGRDIGADKDRENSVGKSLVRDKMVKLAQSCVELNKKIEGVKADIQSNTLYKDLQKKEIKLSRFVEKKEEVCSGYEQTAKEFLKLHSQDDLNEMADMYSFVSLLK